MTKLTQETEDVVAREFLAVAHEAAKKPLVAVDIRTGNLGRMGVMWVETTTALAAIKAALAERQSISDRIDVLEGTIIAMGKIAEDLGSTLAFLNVTDARASLGTTHREVNDVTTSG